MNQVKPLAWLSAALVILAVACSKGGLTSPGGGTGSGALLAKEVSVNRVAQENQLDSVVTLYTYNTNKTLSETEVTSVVESAELTSHQTIITNISYAGGLISGLTGTSTDTIVYPGNITGYVTAQTTINYVASGSRIVSYVEQISGTTTFPGTQLQNLETYSVDSALINYGGNGQVSSYVDYHREGTGAYVEYYTETYTYSGSNLAQTLIIQNDLGHPGAAYVDTTTSVYSHDGRTNTSSTVTIVPGVYVNSVDNLSKLSITTVGFAPSTSTATYNTTLNSSNQPVSSTTNLTLTITTNTATTTTTATETDSFFYQ
jgi:hypothetical protein